MITKRYMTGGINGTTHAYNDPTALVGYTTSFDRTGNKLYERHLEAEDRSHLYQPFNSDGSFGVGYDSANRLLQYQRGVLSTATIPYLVNPGASIATPTTLPGADQVRTYGLDGLGNWKTSNFTLVNSDESTTSTAEVRQHNYVNEITSVKDTTGGTPTTTPFTYDKNGNLLNDGVRIYQYDAFNRLCKVSNSSNTLLASYQYDVLNRRVVKTIADLEGGYGGLTGDIPAGTTLYLHDGRQIVEEGTPSDDYAYVWTQAYFWGQYIDELIFFAVAAETPTTYRVLSDLLYRSVAMVTTSNVVTEAYDCDAYGNTLCYSGPGTDDLWFTDDDVTTHNPINTTIFTGRQYDPESQIYYYRARYYSPTIGRFISRDPLGSALAVSGASQDDASKWNPINISLLRTIAGTVNGYDDPRDIFERLTREPLGSAELSQRPNLYWYAYNNPITLVDPDGLAPGPSIPTSPQVAQLGRQAFGPGGALQGSINQAVLNQASLTNLGTLQYNAQRGLALANSASTTATQTCRLGALNNAFLSKAGPLGAVGAGALATGATALAIGNAPLATSVGILGVGTVGALGAGTAVVGFAAGVGIGNIPTGGGGTVNSAIYNAAPGVWNGIGSVINSL